MSREQTTLSGPVHLSLPSPPPDPVSGCRECLGLSVGGANAGSVGAYSKASDVNVALRANLRSKHGGR